MARLIFQLGDGKTVDFDLSAAVVTLGRSTSNDIVINNGWISSHHAKFERLGGTIEVTSLGTLHGIPLKEYKRIGGSYAVTDLDSHNGVMVNGSRITTAELKSGDILAFGQLEALFEETAAPPAARALIQTDPTADEPEPAATVTPPPLPATTSLPPDLPFAAAPTGRAAVPVPAPSGPVTQHLVKKPPPPVAVPEATPPLTTVRAEIDAAAPATPLETPAPPVAAPAPVVPAPVPAATPAPTGVSAIPTPAVRESARTVPAVVEAAPSPPATPQPPRPATAPRLAPRPEPEPRAPTPTSPATVAAPKPAAPPATTKTAKTALASIQRDVALLERTLGALQENPEPEREHALAKGLIQRIDLLEDLIEAVGKTTPDLAEQLRPLRASLLELLSEHSIEAYTVAPGQALDVATRKRITIVEAATEGEGITEIAEVFRPGYRFTRGSGDLPAVILRKAEVRTLRRPLR